MNRKQGQTTFFWSLILEKRGLSLFSWAYLGQVV